MITSRLAVSSSPVSLAGLKGQSTLAEYSSALVITAILTQLQRPNLRGFFSGLIHPYAFLHVPYM
jgi:hypothetical protein